MKFTELGLSKPTTDVLVEIGFDTATEIQEKAIPIVLSKRDLIASAETGSGKTAAYALPIIELLQTPAKKPKALILVPTRELAIQVEKQFRQFGKNSRLHTVTIYGGTGYGAQIQALRRGVDVIVATPGRLRDHIERGYADLSMIEILVLDEADRMMDMGFMPQVRQIVTKLPKKHQTLMFSATIDQRIERLSKEYLSNPATVRVLTGHVAPKLIEQKIFHVHEFGKDELLVQIIKDSNAESVLVFTRTRRKATWVKNRLRESNIKAEEIHGDIAQRQREKTLASYRQGVFSVLVATDVAARGLDVPSISHVINYDLPESAEDYVHRIGRTGRAGRAGIALSLVSQEQRSLIRNIEKATGVQLDFSAGADTRRKSPPPSRHFRPSKRRRRAF